MIIALDAGAAIALSLRPRNHKGMADLLEKADWVIAPDLIISEVADVCWKYHRFEELPIELCEELLEKSLKSPLNAASFYTHCELVFGILGLEFS